MLIFYYLLTIPVFRWGFLAFATLLLFLLTCPPPELLLAAVPSALTGFLVLEADDDDEAVLLLFLWFWVLLLPNSATFLLFCPVSILDSEFAFCSGGGRVLAASFSLLSAEEEFLDSFDFKWLCDDGFDLFVCLTTLVEFRSIWNDGCCVLVISHSLALWREHRRYIIIKGTFRDHRVTGALNFQKIFAVW